MYDLLIKNGIVVTPEGEEEGNIAVQDGVIAAVLAKGIVPEARKTIDASGKYVFPGAIDTHAHLNDPGYEWREDYAHGTAAAIVGGYTTVIDMPLQNEPAMTTPELFDIKEAKVSPNAYSDYAFWGGLVPDNFDQLEALDEKGVVAFKSFLGPVSPDYTSLTYGQAYEAMSIIKGFDGMAGFHCEDFSMIKEAEKRMKRDGKLTWRDFLDSRTVAAERIATEAVISIAEELDCRAHICHVSHPLVAEKVMEAQMEGYQISAETCGHYLTFTEEDTIDNGPLFKCAPPLRTAEARDMMWDYVENGTFAGLASDHSPCSYDEKYNEILGNKIENVFDVWGGISGIQSCVQAIFSEGVIKRGIAPSALANAWAKLPALAFQIYGKKGDIRPGFDADLVIIDPEKEWEITADSLLYVNKISAFVGLKGQGLPVCTILRGNVMAEDGKVVGAKGTGELVKRQK
jgi:allantoinase